MADEYRVYQVVAEVVTTGIPNPPIRVYGVYAEIVRSLDATPIGGDDEPLNFMSFNPN